MLKWSGPSERTPSWYCTTVTSDATSEKNSSGDNTVWFLTDTCLSNNGLNPENVTSDSCKNRISSPGRRFKILIFSSSTYETELADGTILTHDKFGRSTIDDKVFLSMSLCKTLKYCSREESWTDRQPPISTFVQTTKRRSS